MTGFQQCTVWQNVLSFAVSISTFKVIIQLLILQFQAIVPVHDNIFGQNHRTNCVMVTKGSPNKQWIWAFPQWPSSTSYHIGTLSFFSFKSHKTWPHHSTTLFSTVPNLNASTFCQNTLSVRSGFLCHTSLVLHDTKKAFIHHSLNQFTGQSDVYCSFPTYLFTIFTV